MKIAAAEAQWDNCKPCSFSGDPDRRLQANDQTPNEIIPIPHLLSILATGTWSGPVTGLDRAPGPVSRRSTARATTYPTSRSSIGRCGRWPASGPVLLFALWGGWLLSKGKLRTSRLFLTMSVWAVVTPVPDEHCGLAVDRERTATVDRARPAENRQRELAVGQHHRHLDQLERVRSGLHRPRLADLVLMLRYSRAGWPKPTRKRPSPPAAPVPPSSPTDPCSFTRSGSSSLPSSGSGFSCSRGSISASAPCICGSAGPRPSGGL